MTTPRPTREALLMDTARLWAQRSTCDRAHVGAVLSRDGRILMTGYNGAPAGMEHCSHDCITLTAGGSPIRREWVDPSPCTVAVHAEVNAIAWAARKGVRLEGCELHVTVSPCHGCAKLLINSGVIKVTYDQPHREMDGVQLLLRAGLSVVTEVEANGA